MVRVATGGEAGVVRRGEPTDITRLGLRRRVRVMTTIPDTHRDLLNAQVGVLGTIGASGRPQLSAIWFLADGDTVKLSLNTDRQKVKNLQATPRCSLLILDPASPYRYLELRGDAEISPD